MTEAKGLINPNVQDGEAKRKYDNLAEEYNDKVLNGGGRGHYRAIELFSIYNVPYYSDILDVCCGTGLIGQYLYEDGFYNMYGIDISKKMLKQAKSLGVYKKLYKKNLQGGRLKLDRTFSHMIFFGSLTYFRPDMKVFYNLAPYLRKGGFLFFTHRDDLYHKQGYDIKLKKLKGFELDFISPPHPYLPYNKDYGDDIKIYYIVLRKL